MPLASSHNIYERWLDACDPADSARLIALSDTERVDAFWRDLTVGVGGLHGRPGLGINHMNFYAVGSATQGFSGAKPKVKACVFAKGATRDEAELAAFSASAESVLEGDWE